MNEVGSVLCLRSPVSSVSDLRVISGSVTESSCDFGRIVFLLWASVSPSLKSLRITECQGWEGSERMERLSGLEEGGPGRGGLRWPLRELGVR